MLQVNIFTIKQVINECSIFDKVDMTGFLYNLQPEVTHEKDGKTHQRSNRKYENKNNTCHNSKKEIKIKIKNKKSEYRNSWTCVF